jgi:protein-disulfide isomerase
MIRARTIALAILVGAVGFGICARAAGTGSPPLDRAQIERVVRDYLHEHPEVILDAVQAYKTKQEAAELAEVQKTLAARQAEIANDPASPVGGNLKGDVTLVEFFDYQCGVCKSVHGMVADLVRSDGHIRRVYKDWPILGPASIFAARAALASRTQGKYLAFHDALMAAKAPLSDRAVFAIAKSVGLDVARLKRDTNDPRIAATLQRNFALADALHINGTPSFIIGDVLVSGARDMDSMRALVAQARKKS